MYYRKSNEPVTVWHKCNTCPDEYEQDLDEFLEELNSEIYRTCSACEERETLENLFWKNDTPM